MKHFNKLIALVLCCMVYTSGMASDIVIHDSDWKFTLNASTKKMEIQFQNNVIVSNAFACAKYRTMNNQTEQELFSYDATKVSMQQCDTTDGFGPGRIYTLTYLMNNGLSLLQRISFYNDHTYFLVQLSISSPDTISSNFLEPLISETTATFLPNESYNRMLWVPFDNDSWIRYKSYKLDKSMTSFSATAIFNGVSRNGLVLGAIDHDTWKNGIVVNASDGYKIDTLACLSGYTSTLSRDSLPHGKIVGLNVSSARFMVGYFNDWRTGMEEYGQANTSAVPKLAYEGSAPVGWSSWGVLQDSVSYRSACDISDFIADSLMVHGFHDADGKTVLSLDAYWNDRFTEDQLKSFVAKCKENNQIPGIYYGPFCDFAKWDHSIDGTTRYTSKDLWLKVNGKPYSLDGSYCLDPTHPGTKIAIMTNIAKFIRWGFKYIKLDFLCDGAIEADSYYDPKVTTGIQAYNEGMKFLLSKIDGNMYIDLSISPIFPYQYAQGRRTCCDSYGLINETKYVMNSTSYGWWTNQFYSVNDPDHLVMKGKDNNGLESDGVNRARLTSGAITGAYLTGDNFSYSVDRGYPSKSRVQALKFLTNEDVNKLVHTCKSFRPVEGYMDDEDGAESLFSYETTDYVYFTIINYKQLVNMSGDIPFSRLGVDASKVDSVKELWTSSNVSFTSDGFHYLVLGTDARIYRIHKKKSDSTNLQTTLVHEGQVTVFQDGDILSIKSADLMKTLSLYSIDGILINRMQVLCNTAQMNVISLMPGFFLVKIEKANGKIEIHKIRIV